MISVHFPSLTYLNFSFTFSVSSWFVDPETSRWVFNFFPAKSNRVFLKAMHVSYIVKGIRECSIKQLKFYHLTIFMDLIGISVARKKCSSLKKAGIKSKNLNQSSIIIIIIHCKNSMVWKHSNNWIFCPLYSIASFHTFSTFILFGRTKKYLSIDNIHGRFVYANANTCWSFFNCKSIQLIVVFFPNALTHFFQLKKTTMKKLFNNLSARYKNRWENYAGIVRSEFFRQFNEN